VQPRASSVLGFRSASPEAIFDGVTAMRLCAGVRSARSIIFGFLGGHVFYCCVHSMTALRIRVPSVATNFVF